MRSCALGAPAAALACGWWAALADDMRGDNQRGVALPGLSHATEH